MPDEGDYELLFQMWGVYSHGRDSLSSLRIRPGGGSRKEEEARKAEEARRTWEAQKAEQARREEEARKAEEKRAQEAWNRWNAGAQQQEYGHQSWENKGEYRAPWESGGSGRQSAWDDPYARTQDRMRNMAARGRWTARSCPSSRTWGRCF